MGVSQFLPQSRDGAIDPEEVSNSAGSLQSGEIRDGLSEATPLQHELIRVFVPAYNEEGAIADLLDGLVRVLSEARERFSILVVDDGSTDSTPDIVQAWGRRHPIHLVRHEVNRNLGGAMATGLAVVADGAAPDDIIVTMDADNTASPRGHSLAAGIDPQRSGRVCGVTLPAGWGRSWSSLPPSRALRRRESSLPLSLPDRGNSRLHGILPGDAAPPSSPGPMSASEVALF